MLPNLKEGCSQPSQGRPSLAADWQDGDLSFARNPHLVKVNDKPRRSMKEY